MEKNELFECPYCISTKCDLKLNCFSCETFGEYCNGKTITRLVKHIK